ncbi:MAG: phosphate ABC transporter permease PstA [Chitinivibrionales bacterium]
MKTDPTVILRRKIINRVMVALFSLAVLISIGALAAILWKLSVAGLKAFSIDIFTKGTPAPGTAGGLLNAIVGSIVLVVTGLAGAIPLGVLAGTYLAEYGRDSRMGNVVRFCTDILLSAPSIIIGLFIYGIIVLPSGHFSAWAGAAALCLVAVPVIVRTTEDMLCLVPDSLREAAVALGCPYWKMIVKIGWRAARPGIVTGILLALARISGETAPLLFTSLNNQFSTSTMNGPIASLPIVIFQFAMSPYKDWQNLAWSGAFLITITVLAINIFSRRILFTKRHN